jgi:hypothetical protein
MGIDNSKYQIKYRYELLVPDVIIRPVFSVSALTCFMSPPLSGRDI